MPISLGNAFIKNFLGKAPDWYKVAIIAFLIINPIVFFLINPFVAGWLLVAEFIFTLAMALNATHYNLVVYLQLKLLLLA